MKVTVLGITGGVGHAVAKAFLEHGVPVRALVRSAERARALLGSPAGLELVEGDARSADDLAAALEGATVVFHGLNLPYPAWDPGMMELTERVLAAAVDAGATVLFPGNVYGLGPAFDQPLGEDCAHDPVARRKGVLRNRLEAQLAASSAQTIVLRMGDFFGGIGESSWMFHLTQGALEGAPLSYAGDRDVLHSWTYLPDAAETFVRLAQRRHDLGGHEVFHFAGHVVDGHRWVEAARHALGDPHRRVKSFPWFWMQLARPFVPMIRELFEMRYLWNEPVRMRQDKLEQLLGSVPHTPFEEAMAQSLAA